MGLFENPYPASVANHSWSSLIHTSEAVELARTLDRESIILLENHNNSLPLKKSGSIAVIGPMAHGFMNVSYRYAALNLPILFLLTLCQN
jgi:beta-glucosidase